MFWCRLLFSCAILLLPSIAYAHLALITMGPESTGRALTGFRFGSAVAAGDFNGDGIDDLATAAPNSDEFGLNNGQENALILAVRIKFLMKKYAGTHCTGKKN